MPGGHGSDVEVATGPAIGRRNDVHNVDDQSLNSCPHALPIPMHPYEFSPDVAVVLAVVTVVVGVVVATVPFIDVALGAVMTADVVVVLVVVAIARTLR